MNGKELLDALMQKFEAKNDNDLATKLGLSQATVSQLRGREENVSKTQIVNIVTRSRQVALEDFAAHCIKPIVEFYPIDLSKSKGGANWELFNREVNQYTKGLYKELLGSNGVYIFYDSCGKAIYAGKAAQQNLWKEMTSALNRDRGENQTIRAVQHPTQNQAYKPTEEKSRQIIKMSVYLCDIAAYFSAYSVVGELIDSMEAFLVRAFANDILNKKMENFSSL